MKIYHSNSLNQSNEQENAYWKYNFYYFIVITSSNSKHTLSSPNNLAVMILIHHFQSYFYYPRKTCEYFMIQPLEIEKNVYLSCSITCLSFHIYYLDTKIHFYLLLMQSHLPRYSRNHRGKSKDFLFSLVLLVMIR